MNIIIEGPDATGKTTLAEKILANYELDTIHGTAKTPNDLPYYLDLLNKDNQIFDRFHLSEYIFPQIYGRPFKLTYQEFKKITEELIATDTFFVIFLTSNMDILNERLIARGEYDYLKEINYQNELFKLYAEYFKQFNYDRYYVIDIAEPNAYEKLDEWLRSKGVNI